MNKIAQAANAAQYLHQTLDVSLKNPNNPTYQESKYFANCFRKLNEIVLANGINTLLAYKRAIVGISRLLFNGEKSYESYALDNQKEVDQIKNDVESLKSKIEAYYSTHSPMQEEYKKIVADLGSRESRLRRRELYKASLIAKQSPLTAEELAEWDAKVQASDDEHEDARWHSNQLLYLFRIKNFYFPLLELFTHYSDVYQSMAKIQ